MKLQLNIIQMYFVLSVLRTTSAYSDVPEHFCGKHLSNFLGSKCKLYNSPSTGKHRVRRAIVDECCRKPCSQRYLLCNYCAKSDVVCSQNGIQSTHSTSKQENDSFYSVHTVNDVPRQVVEKRVNSSKADQQQKQLPCRRRFQRCRPHRPRVYSSNRIA